MKGFVIELPPRCKEIQYYSTIITRDRSIKRKGGRVLQESLEACNTGGEEEGWQLSPGKVKVKE